MVGKNQLANSVPKNLPTSKGRNRGVVEPVTRTKTTPAKNNTITEPPSFRKASAKRCSRLFSAGLRLDLNEASLEDMGNSKVGVSMPNLSEMISSARETKNECFQWGNGVKILEKPKILRGKHIKSVKSGGSHALAVLDNGDVYTWGEGRCGQLGLGSENDIPQPRKIPLPEPIDRIYAGFTQSAFIGTSGKIYICGLIGSSIFTTPEPCIAFDNVEIMDIAFGPSSIALLGRSIQKGLGNDKILSPPTIWVWGHSRKGHLGIPGRNTIEEPCELESLKTKNVIQIACGEFHTCALTESGEVYIWGSCEANGTGEEGLIESPTLVLGLEAKNIIKVVCGSACTFVLSKNGQVYSWGSGRHGILGHGTTDNYEFPGLISSLKGKIIGISTGGLHTCVWTTDGCVYSWGNGRHFALGFISGDDVYSPQLVDALADGKKITDLSCGSNDTIALVQREVIEVTFKNQTSILPIHSHPFVGHIIRKLAAHYNLRQEDLFLLNSENKQLGNSDSVRDLKLDGHSTLTLISKPSMYDYADKDLIFLPPDAERIKLGCDATPQVKGGTISKLIEWLTFPKPTGHEYTATFLLSYRTFMTSEDLIEELKNRFNNPTVRVDAITKLDLPGFKEIQSEESSKRIIKLRVLNAIKRWLTSHIDNFIGRDTEEVGNLIRTFIRTTCEGDPDFERESNNIIRLTNDLNNERPPLQIEQFPNSSPASEPCHDGKWDIYKYSAAEIARQMTLIDYFFYFRKIQAGELIGQAWSKSNKEDLAPNLLSMIRRFNEVSQWVAKVILTGRTQVARTAFTERFIDIADELFKINSFDCVMSIMSAFNSSALHRLKSIWETKNGGISQSSLEKLKKLQNSLSVAKNMVSYRDMFDTLAPPKIPFMGKYLQDLTFIDDGNQDFLDDEKRYINFDKRSKLASIISVIQRLQKDAYIFTEIPECIENLRQVSGFGGDQEATAYSISRHIESKAGVITNDISEIDDPKLKSIIQDTPVIARRKTISQSKDTS